jgi:hypothetical protein
MYDAHLIGHPRHPELKVHFDAESDEAAIAIADHSFESGAWGIELTGYKLWNVQYQGFVHVREVIRPHA